MATKALEHAHHSAPDRRNDIPVPDKEETSPFVSQRQRRQPGSSHKENGTVSSLLTSPPPPRPSRAETDVLDPAYFTGLARQQDTRREDRGHSVPERQVWERQKEGSRRHRSRCRQRSTNQHTHQSGSEQTAQPTTAKPASDTPPPPPTGPSSGWSAKVKPRR